MSATGTNAKNICSVNYPLHLVEESLAILDPLTIEDWSREKDSLLNAQPPLCESRGVCTSPTIKVFWKRLERHLLSSLSKEVSAEGWIVLEIYSPAEMHRQC
ncbi:hypothetical protein EB796_021031 [Bugula neritina]|uniref:Uncharacterized protein n=1 Tax=Bugula neritina TaxID=10212 RepID=A0A7J7J4R2_BUGNE|nr:hypothetical protein EB796_021031 [Bugula neritina]